MENKWKDNSLSREMLSLVEKYPSIVIYDLETTGLSKKKDKIIQFSAIRYKLPEVEETERIDIYIKCPFSVPETASEVNHITDELLAEQGISEKDAFLRISRFIKPDDLIGGYNNKSFDDKFMEILYKENKREFTFSDNIDVFKYAKSIIPPEKVMEPTEVRNKNTGEVKLVDKPCYKLEKISSYLVGENYQFHSSIEDVAATGCVLGELLELSRELVWCEEQEEKARKSIPRQKATVLSVSFFNPSQNLKRVYVNTDQGTIYYNELNHKWAAKTGSVNSIDMTEVIAQVFRLSGAKDESNLFYKMEKKDKVSIPINCKKQKIIWKIIYFILKENDLKHMEEAFDAYMEEITKEHLYGEKLWERLMADNLALIREYCKDKDEKEMIAQKKSLKKESRRLKEGSTNPEDLWWELKTSEEIEELYAQL